MSNGKLIIVDFQIDKKKRQRCSIRHGLESTTKMQLTSLRVNQQMLIVDGSKNSDPRRSWTVVGVSDHLYECRDGNVMTDDNGWRIGTSLRGPLALMI